MSLRFSPFLSFGEVRNSRRECAMFETGDAKFAISNMKLSEQTRFTGMRCQRRDSPDQLWSASSELAFCEQSIGQLRLLEQTKRSVIPAIFAARGIRSSSKNFSVSSAARWCLRTIGEIA
jgi:hypothetical protein